MMLLWGLSDLVVIPNICALGVEAGKLFLKEVASSLPPLEFPVKDGIEDPTDNSAVDVLGTP
jgi:hypothetical protein